MSKKFKDMTDEELDDRFDKVWFTLVGGVAVFIGGYITGRLTAIKDLENGLLDDFIPKNK